MRCMSGVLCGSLMALLFAHVGIARSEDGPLSVVLTTVLGYDDNVFNEPDGTGEPYLNSCLAVELERHECEGLDWHVAGEFDHEKYVEHTEADSYSLSGEFGAEKNITSRNRLEARYRATLFRYGDLWTGDRDTASDFLGHELRLQLRHSYSDKTAVRCGLRMTAKDYSEADREDITADLSVGWSFNALPLMFPVVEVQLQQNDSSQAPYDYTSAVVGLLFLVPIGEKTYVLNFDQVQIKEYPARQDILPDASSQKDKKILVVLSLIHEISDVFTVELTYSHHRNASNFDPEDYAKNVVGAGLEITF